MADLTRQLLIQRLAAIRLQVKVHVPCFIELQHYNKRIFKIFDFAENGDDGQANEEGHPATWNTGLQELYNPLALPMMQPTRSA